VRCPGSPACSRPRTGAARRAHAEDRVHEDRVEGSEEDEEEGGPRTEPEQDHGERQPGRDGYRPQDLEGRVEKLAHEGYAADHETERQRGGGGQQETAIDPADRGQNVDVQRLAERIVVDAAEGQIVERDSDLGGGGMRL
jgi:hypothetical protein